MIHHVTNWTLLWFALGGYTLNWLRRDRRITRLSKRVRHFERQWRICRDSRDRALEAARAVRAENEALTGDLAHAIYETQIARHARQDEAELFTRLERDFT